MGYPITGRGAKITCATSSTDLNHIFGTADTSGSVRVISFTPSLESGEHDITGFRASGVTSASFIAGLRSGTIDFEALYPNSTSAAAATTPRLGNSGLVTFGSGYVYLVDSWSLDVDFGEEDITGMDGTAIGARSYMPGGVVSWRGSWSGRFDSATAPTDPSAVNSAGAAATFKLTEDGANDASFTGSIIVPRGPRVDVAPRSQVKVSYDFMGTGDLTAVAGSTLPCIFPAGVVDSSDWDTSGTDGAADVQVVATFASGRTLTSYAFLRSVRVQCNIGEPIRVSGSLRLTGAWTVA